MKASVPGNTYGEKPATVDWDVLHGCRKSVQAFDDKVGKQNIFGSRRTLNKK